MDIQTQRHSLAHIMASAVQKLFQDNGFVRFGVGPVIDNGFYYDIETKQPITENDLEAIEQKMHTLLKQHLDFIRTEVPLDEALKKFDEMEQPYKIELLNDIKTHGTTEINEINSVETPRGGVSPETVSLYTTGDFIDLCRGPHVKNTQEIIASFKLTSLAGAYWRGDEHNPQLQRLYAVAFETQEELDKYLRMREEAIKRDPRKLGKELELFVFSDLVGPGLPLYTHHVMTVLSAIKNYSRELRTDMGYQEVQTPQINKAALFKTSGHYDKYKQDMFRVVSNYTEEEYYLKPMNCPQHTQIYASRMRSYIDLPVRIADFSLLYRDEKPGELSGLTRLRSFSQDDSHCFCREDQIEHECSLLLNAIQEAMQTYGMNYSIRLSLRDESQKEKYLGDDKIWETSQNALRSMLKQSGINYEEAPGEAAFYGPKMDLIAKDSLGREWQLSTIQIDFNMPARFKLEYIGADGQKHTPVMIHSAIAGSPERFMAILIE